MSLPCMYARDPKTDVDKPTRYQTRKDCFLHSLLRRTELWIRSIDGFLLNSLRDSGQYFDATRLSTHDFGDTNGK